MPRLQQARSDGHSHHDEHGSTHHTTSLPQARPQVPADLEAEQRESDANRCDGDGGRDEGNMIRTQGETDDQVVDTRPRPR